MLTCVGVCLSHDSTDLRRRFLDARAAPPPRLIAARPDLPCDLQHSTGGYWEACGGAETNLGSFSGLTATAAQEECCANESCAGFSYSCSLPSCEVGSGFYKANVDCGFVAAAGYEGYAKSFRLPASPNVTVTVSPSEPLTEDMVVVNVTYAFLNGGAPNRSTDFVAQVCSDASGNPYPIEDYIEFSPIDFFSASWATGSAWATFPVFRSRCNFTFVYYRGKQPLWPSGVALGASAPVTWARSWATVPFHTHIAYGGEDAQHSMVVSFATNSTPSGPVLVQVGTASGVYDLGNATDAESTTYGASDLCNAPANTTSLDFWQDPGVFHHVTVRGLAPGTRYFARPVAGGVPGDEISFVTGKALGAEVPVTFASYGDMSVTQYVLDGDSEHDAPNGGPGAVGTARRLRARIDAEADIDFVAHYGDLGYAKGAVFLWDAYMAMMAHVGSSVPYMVSIGSAWLLGIASCRRVSAVGPYDDDLCHVSKSHPSYCRPRIRLPYAIAARPFVRDL